MQTSHHILWVPIQVKPECVEEFVQVANANAQSSRQEEQVVHFEVLKNQESATDFVLLEIYKTPEGHKQHQQTEHYKLFKQQVQALLQQPYSRQLYTFITENQQ